MLAMARSGGLNGALVSTDWFYQTNFTKSLLFLSDGSYLESLAAKEHLLGSQWGMMNETPLRRRLRPPPAPAPQLRLH